MLIKMTKVLIVEDEAIIAEEIESTLHQLKYHVVGKARNGDRALDLMANTNPDIALLDINIKGTLSGIDLAKIIRKKFHFPFIFLTAYADTRTLEEVKATLPYGYIVKPFKENDIKTSIELALHQYKAEQLPEFPSRQQVNRQLTSPLTEREYQILQHLNQGFTYRAIGEQLFLSINTIKTHQKTLFQKLGVNSRHQAVARVSAFTSK